MDADEIEIDYEAIAQRAAAAAVAEAMKNRHHHHHQAGKAPRHHGAGKTLPMKPVVVDSR